MQTKTCDIAKEVRALRAALSVLAEHLEPFEEWRALRQLDERERAGDPLQSIDGVLVRGRLARQLGEKSRAWRAYVRIEEAIGELIGPDVVEPTILKVAKPLDLPIPAAVVAIAVPAGAHAPASAPEPVSGGLSAPVGASIEAPVTAAQPAQPAELSEVHQRLRVKVRAASVAIPMIVAAASLPREVKKAEAAPSEEQPSAVALKGGADERAALASKDILERIRPVHDLDLKSLLPDAQGASAGSAAVWGTRAIDAPEPEIEIIQKAADRSLDDGVPSAVSGVVEPVVAGVLEPAVQPQIVSLPINPPAVIEVSDLAVEAAVLDVAKIAPARIAAVEAAISRLADPEIVRWTAPLELIESRVAADAGKEKSPGRSSGIGIDHTDDDISVDEAEVEIVARAHPEPEVATRSELEEIAAPKNGVTSRLRQASNSTGDPADSDDHVNPAEYAAYHLDVEEASVEIIVPVNEAARSAG